MHTPAAGHESELVHAARVAVPNASPAIDGAGTAPAAAAVAAAATSEAVNSEDTLFQKALEMIGRISNLPGVYVERESFLRKQFEGSPYIDTILAEGPQAVYTPDSLRKKAKDVINDSTTKTAVVSFVSGLPSNPVTMVAAGGADVVQYFGFALKLAQRLAYLFGEDELFDGGQDEMSNEAKLRVLAYLGAMLGVSGAGQLITRTSVKVGATLGKRTAAKALTKTMWYPLVKKIGALVGQNITKKTVEKTITKAVPIIGGAMSGVLTFATFRPMGERLADVFVANLKGELVDDVLELELNPEFVAEQMQDAETIEPSTD